MVFVLGIFDRIRTFAERRNRRFEHRSLLAYRTRHPAPDSGADPHVEAGPLYRVSRRRRRAVLLRLPELRSLTYPRFPAADDRRRRNDALLPHPGNTGDRGWKRRLVPFRLYPICYEHCVSM